MPNLNVSMEFFTWDLANDLHVCKKKTKKKQRKTCNTYHFVEFDLRNIKSARAVTMQSITISLKRSNSKVPKQFHLLCNI